MPPVTKKSALGASLRAKYGAKADAAVAAHAGDDTVYGFIRLPGGIPKGVAQLMKCYCAQYTEDKDKYKLKKGDWYFQARASVLEPVGPVASTANPHGPVMTVAGLSTSLHIPIAACVRYGRDTTLDENVNEIMNHMRRLTHPGFTDGRDSIDDIEELCAEIEDMGPYFIFSTEWVYAAKDNPQSNPPIKKGDLLGMINEHWHGNQGLDDYEPPVQKGTRVSSGVGAAPADEGNGDAKSPAARPGMRATPKPGTPSGNGAKAPASKPAARPAARPAPEPEPEPEPEDLDVLAADASDENSATQRESGDRLIEIAVEAGIEEGAEDGSEEGTARGAPSWDDLVVMIRDVMGEGDDADDQDRGQAWEVGMECMFAPYDSRLKKKGKPVKCEITEIDTDEQKVTLKSGKAVYKDKSFEDISPVEE
jgi:hypothetical protein